LASVEKQASTNLNIDLIRIVAIFMVILIHATTEYNPCIVDIMSPQGIELWWATNVYNALSRGSVPLFIMVSGFLLLQPSKYDEPLGVFLKKRWRRIGLPVIFWGAIYFAWNAYINNQPVNTLYIAESILSGPYQQFWFIYLLIGLYLLTPLIRVVVAHADLKLIKYFLIIWFIGTAIVPMFKLYTPLIESINWFDSTIFTQTGLIGYFILGAYITKLKIRKPLLYLTFIGSSLITIFGTYFIVRSIGGKYWQFFYDYTSFNIIFATISLFLILYSLPIPKKFPKASKTLRIIGASTLGIYLLHYIPLEVLQKGLIHIGDFQLKLSVSNVNPIIQLPLVSILTMLICIAIILPAKKVPILRRLIA
jgi:surface polysaccharide O-acyltransferase-like enzyme